MSKWPIFDLRHHERGIAEVQCFNCNEWFAPFIESSGNAKGHGRYVGQCPACKLRTWYDLRDETNGH